MPLRLTESVCRGSMMPLRLTESVCRGSMMPLRLTESLCRGSMMPLRLSIECMQRSYDATETILRVYAEVL